MQAVDFPSLDLVIIDLIHICRRAPRPPADASSASLDFHA
jgi:hypothetical protein